MKRELIFRPDAAEDLKALYDCIERDNPDAGARYVVRIEEYCMGLVHFPERGTRRDDLMKGMRIVGFARRVSIAFKVLDDRVEIARIRYGGRDLGSALDELND